MSGELRIEGRVVDEEHRPVVDARVLLEPGDQTATTGDDGAFVFDGLEPQQYSVSANKGDVYAGRVLVSPSTQIVLRTQLGATLLVHVLADRKVVGGAKLTLHHSVRAIADSSGTVTARGLGPGDYHGWVWADGFAPERLHFSVHEDPGGVLECDCVLHPGARIEGKVVGPEGEPIANAGVSAHCRFDDPSRLYHNVSDADGTWRLDVRAGTYELGAHSRGHRHGAAIVLESDGRTPQRDLVVRVGEPLEVGTSDPGVIAGVVVEEDGHPAVVTRMYSL